MGRQRKEWGPMPDLYKTVITRVVTEKQASGYAERREEVFKVDTEATKPQIRHAIEELFGVRVRKVRTLIQPARRKTLGRSAGRRAKWKKAYVTLHPDDLIEGLEG